MPSPKSFLSDEVSKLKIIPQDEYDAIQEKERLRGINKQMSEAGFPALHMARQNLETSGSGSSWMAAYSATLSSIKTPGAVVALIGKRGTGKTQIATTAVRKMMTMTANGISVRYVRAMEFFMTVKDSYSAATSERNAFDLFTRPQLMVLDEVQVRNGTNWESSALTYLIDSRYSSMRATILISNELQDAFAESLGDSIMDRMTETGAIIECDWKSFRG